jgi:hypothetical protein
MSSRFVKLTCAAALALPLAAVATQSASAQDFPAENDCNHHFSGAITSDPHQSDRCYGIDQHIRRERPSGDVYRGTTIVVQDGKGAVHCNRGDYFYGIFYSTPDNHEAFRSLHDLETVAGVDITPQDGVPNGAVGDIGGNDGTTVTAACRDTA